MAVGAMSITGEATAEPSVIRVFLAYKRLPSSLFGITCLRFSTAYNAAVEAAYGRRTLTFVRGTERFESRPELDLAYAATGSSIHLKFSEGWHPTFELDDSRELVIGLPRQTAVPLLLVGALVSAAISGLVVANQIQDFRLKGIELQQTQIELKLKEQQLDAALQNPKLREKAQDALEPVLKSSDITSCQINGIDVKH